MSRAPLVVVTATFLLGAAPASAQVAVQRTRFQLPASNGHGAVVVDLASTSRRITHFREHLFAAEEPQLDAAGEEIWTGNGFATVHTRDLLYDAYFGLRGPGGNTWLTAVAVDEDESGYLGFADGESGGTGIVTMVQSVGDLRVTQYVFAPMDLPRASFVMLVRVQNTGAATISDVQAFSLHNFHLGFGRPASPWELFTDIGENGETLEVQTGGGSTALVERGFAGVVAGRSLGDVAHYGTAPAGDPYMVVAGGGTANLADDAPSGAAVSGAVGALQFDLGDLGPGEQAWAGVAFAHHGDPFAGAATLAELDAWIAGRDPEAVLTGERARWAELQDSLTLPAGIDALEGALVRQSAAMLRMGQVRESSAYLREWLDQDGVPRRTRFPTIDAPATLPAEVDHLGHGAILASLPPGNWTYAWIRDGAYATTAMAALGMDEAAHDSLLYYLQAEGGRFVDWTELAAYDMPEYLVTLTRYYGFGVEETDFNEYGPNLEFDGFGLFLWALRNYEVLTGDTSLADAHWDTIATRVADPIVALVDPSTGLLRRDSSIWETHWNGRERSWTYTNITAVRGLCDAADMAERRGDRERAAQWRDAAIALREAIAVELTDASGALASNREELQAGTGHYDAAVLDAIAMGLFDPEGQIAHATLAALDEHLLVEASGVGWSRNDDRWDHRGSEDLSPWGSEYDSAEWVITDLRGAMATRAAGDAARSDAILQWVLAQSFENYLMIAETYDEVTGVYEFNHPMLGFGAGAYPLALFHRAGMFGEPACGEYFEGGGGKGDTGGTADSGGSGVDDTSGADATASGGGTGSGATMSGGGITISASGDDGAETGEGEVDGPGSGCSCDAGSDREAGWLGLFVGLGLVRRRRAARRVALVAAVGLGLGACGGDDGGAAETDGSTGPGATITIGTTLPGDDAPTTTASVDDTGSSDAATDDGTTGGDFPPEVDVCPTAITFPAPGGESSVRVAGEWQGFDLPTATPMEGPSGGSYGATIDLPPGTHAYKIVYDQGGETHWVLNPDEGRRKYVDDVENSAVRVPDCNLPRLAVVTSEPVRTGPDAGTYHAELEFHDGAQGSGADPAAYEAVLRSGGDERPLEGGELTVDAATGDAAIDLEGLPDGKHTVVVRAATRSGKIGEALRLVFWIETEPFDWNDAIVYMVMTDRYRNGDPSNDGGPVMGADGPGDFWGGDLEGLRQSIAEGTLDELGVRAIWLSPWQTNPDTAYLAADGQHDVTGYHGYWPIRAREVDARLGGPEALHALVDEAHAHGIRILQDYVINHVHEEHEYFAEHPEWFRTGCVCGTPGCDWTAQALECLFQPYMPDIDHRVFEANQQWVDDALWWLEEFDLDGLRVDAVKHVEEAAINNLAVSVRETFEPAGTRYFLMGETAMGWGDCADPCNDENYGTIAKYIGPHGLDGQFDFVLYHGVSYRTFAHGQTGMLHADYWFRHGLEKWPEGAIMTPYVGSHDTARFATLADYRGQDGAHPMNVPGNQWFDIAVAPSDPEPYWRTRLAMAWVLTLPGAPLLYYGDEYGQWGGADPNNRAMWRPEGDLGPWEAETLQFVRLVGQARREIAALRRGEYVSLHVTDDVLVFGRLVAPGDAAIVALNRTASAVDLDVGVIQLGLEPGTQLADALGGPSATVTGGGDLPVSIPPHGAVILAP